MLMTATCAHCGKPLKSVHLTLPGTIAPHPATTPTLNNCRNCGARGALIEIEEAPQDGR